MLETKATARPNSVAVIIATRGRPLIVRDLVARLRRQSRPPDHIFVIGSEPADLAGFEGESAGLTLRVGRRGSATQRNDGLALAGENFAYVAFFDDDFIPSTFWLERMAGLFGANPEIASLTGTVLADGAHGPGIPISEGAAAVAARDAAPGAASALHEGFGPYGCNMAFRCAAMAGLRFDERLQRYAWLEDSDFGGQISRFGRLARAEALWGVHLGEKAGRSRGVGVGYAQIANTFYLARKGTLSVRFLANLALRNLAMNALRALKPEPHIDRRGRLRGNLLALWDIARLRSAPERVAELG